MYGDDSPGSVTNLDERDRRGDPVQGRRVDRAPAGLAQTPTDRRAGRHQLLVDAVKQERAQRQIRPAAGGEQADGGHRQHARQQPGAKRHQPCDERSV